MRVAIQEAATDPRTGQIDMDLITTGRSAASRQTISSMKRAISEILDTLGTTGKVTVSRILSCLSPQRTHSFATLFLPFFF